MKKIILASFLFFAASGCSNLFNQHAQLMDAMRGVMADTASRLSESGNGQIAAGGQVINPGIEVEGGMKYFAVARYAGVAGQVTASMQGGLDRSVSESTKKNAEAIWRNTTLSPQEKVEAFKYLVDKVTTTQPVIP